MKDKELRIDFEEPPAKYRAKPFWAWNGELEKEELFRQIQVMKEMGFGGFFMHSRTGLVTEYLGDEWFSLTNECADEGKRLGMEAWLYDEDRWPSGSAGGLVTKHKKNRAKFIEMKIVRPSEYTEQPRNIAAVFSCSIEGNYFENLKRLEGDCFENLKRLKGDCFENLKRTEGGRFEKPRGMEGIDVQNPCLGLNYSAHAETFSDTEVLLIFSIMESPGKDVYNGFTYLDTMNSRAVADFMEVTHTEYEKRCGDRLGAAVRGIFTDEPHRGAMFSSFSEGSEDRVPYTDALFHEFQEKCGYDLKERLPYLFLREKGTEFSKTAFDYVEVCQQLFLESFARPIQKWCLGNQMMFTGHVLHEDSLSAQTVMQGSLMRFYEYMDYPGIDILTEHNNCWWVVKQAASVARQLDKPFVLSELYGGTGWQMSMEHYKQVGDWQALFGVNLRCPHLSWYTMQGEAKRDYPASIFYQSAWYREYEKLETYFSRVGVFTSKGKAECELLVLNPIESVWGYCRSGAFSGLEAKDKRIVELEKRYQECFDILVRGHIDFDYGEETLLARYGRVMDDSLYVGCCSYKRVLVAGLDTIRSSTLDMLETFREQGGTVIFAGELPAFVDGERSDRVEAAADRCTRIGFEKETILRSCRSGNEIRITGHGAEDILCRSSLEDGTRYVMLLNSNRKCSHRNIKINLGKGSKAELWDARTGEVKSIVGKDGGMHRKADSVLGGEMHRTADSVSGHGSIHRMAYFVSGGEMLLTEDSVSGGEMLLTVEFAPGGEMLLAVEMAPNGEMSFAADSSPDEERIFAVDSAPSGEKRCQLSAGCVPELLNESHADPLSYSLSEDNILVLDKVTAVIEGKQITDEVLKADRQIRAHLGIPARGGEMLQPWFAEKYKGKKSESKWPARLKYNFNICKIPPMLKLAFEDAGHVTGIWINGTMIGHKSDEHWIDLCFTCVQIMGSLLKAGKNDIEIGYDYQVNNGVEAVYLLGEFGVYMNTDSKEWEISEPPLKIHIGDISDQGLPFYSGAIRYVIPKRKGSYRIENLNFSGSCLEVIGDTQQILFAPPYRCRVDNPTAIEVVLTRRNTFGPLHCADRDMFAYGPEAFHTEGDMWDEEHVLIEQGLLKMPRFCLECDEAARSDNIRQIRNDCKRKGD